MMDLTFEVTKWKQQVVDNICFVYSLKGMEYGFRFGSHKYIWMIVEETDYPGSMRLDFCIPTTATPTLKG